MAVHLHSICMFTFFQLLTTTSSSSLNPTFYSGIYHINMAKQSNTNCSSGDAVAVANNIN
jgi:hypothetical protein